jgi:hypothetical protein
MMSRSSPPRRRCAGSEIWAPPPGRSTAARSPMGWTRAPARGPAAAPPSSTGHHGCHVSVACGFLAILVKFLRSKERDYKGRELKEGAAAVFGRAGRRSSPPPAGRRPRARKDGRRRPLYCAAGGSSGENEMALGFLVASALLYRCDLGGGVLNR